MCGIAKLYRNEKKKERLWASVVKKDKLSSGVGT